ncbi:Cell cycle control protein 50A [Hypsibius exemplaris]|uniref:Cell cycle control protein 50A n=1 Tax=Hypsibius exemplaris TaxID=2072580 RepID=A0A1W0WL01_HYPEX|nr:Cell cycle control protein 50A [Hypsibius exemplaris]
MAQPTEAVTAAMSHVASGSGVPHQPDESRRSRKPANTKFKQQQLPAWQPMLTARSVLPFLVAIGVAFIPIGIALFLSAANVYEIQRDYTQCKELGKDVPCANFSFSSQNPICHCQEFFSLDKQIAGPVYIYYGLDNFYQNHRKYVKSRDDNQLMGGFQRIDIDKQTGPSKDCDPFASVKGNGTYGYAPCGAIANSLFNDSIALHYLGNPTDAAAGVNIQPVGLLKTGIAWKSDKDIKFRNPRNASGIATRQALIDAMKNNNLEKPPYWSTELWNLDTEDQNNNGLQNEDLIVWMRTAAFPSFRKLYRRVNHVNTFADGLPVGNYSFEIDYRYPVTAFEGRKYVIISSVSWIGGRNPFLGIAYMTVGCVCLLLAAIFFFIHVKWGKKPSDMMNVTSASHCYEADAFAGLTVDTPYHRRTLREAFLLDRTEPSTPASSSRSPMSSSRWLETIPSSNEVGRNTNSSSNNTTTRGGNSTATTTPNSSQGKQRVRFGQLNSPRFAAADNQVKVQVVSSLGGLRTGQTIHELLNDVLANVTVVSTDDTALDLANRRSSPRKSIIRPEDAATERDVRMRRRQMIDQPVLVD